MALRILPLLLVFTIAATPARAQGLGDFSRFSKAIDKQIALVNTDGTVREGVIVAAGPDSVTMQLGSGTRSFANGQIASADRMKDGRDDGVFKGALWALLFASLGSQGLTSSDNKFLYFVEAMALGGAIGYALDAGETNRQPLYRAPAQQTAAPKQKLGLSLSFRF